MLCDRKTQANLSAASAIRAGLRLEDEVIQRILQRGVMQESTVSQSIQREAQIEEKRAIALNSLQEGLWVEIVAQITGLAIEQIQQLQQQLNESTQN